MATALLRRALHLRRVLPSPTIPLPAASAHRLLSSSIPTTAASPQSADESRRHLVNRCKQGAFLGMGSWVEQHVHAMDEADIRTLLLALDPDCLFSQETPNIWKWLTGQEQPPEDLKSDLVFSTIKSKITK